MKKTLIAALATTAALPLCAQTDTLRHELDNVVVTGTRGEADVRHLPMTVDVVARPDLTKNMRVNVLPTLSEQVPGMFVTSRGLLGYGVSDGAAGGISIRGLGSGSGRTLVLIDGHPQYMGLFGHSISDSYQTMLADRVEVVRGPASVLYGSNAMGGVVNIVTRRIDYDAVRTDANLAYGSFNTLQSSLTNRVRRGKFSSTIAASYDRTDGHRDRLDFEQYGGYLKLGYDFAPHWSASADVDITHFNAQYPGARQQPVYGAKQWVTRGVASAVVENKYAKTSGAVSFFINFGRHKINDGHGAGEEPPTAYFRSTDQLLGLSAYQSAELWRGNRTTIGLDYQHVAGKAKNTDIATHRVTARLADRKEDIFAGYADVRQDVARWLSIDAGLRVDHNSHVGTEVVPQAGLAFRLPADASLKAMVSKGFRNPSIRELYMFRPANPDLKPERLWSYDVGFAQRLLGGRLRYGLNLFYINGDNLIQTVMGQQGPRNINTGKVENWGIEIEGKYRINGQLSLNANYSGLHMERHVVGSPEHKLFAGADFHRKAWAVSAGLQYVANLFTQVGRSETTQDFWLLNVTASWRPCKVVQLYVRGENLLAQRYEINHGYPMPRATFMGGVNVSL